MQGFPGLPTLLASATLRYEKSGFKHTSIGVGESKRLQPQQRVPRLAHWLSQAVGSPGTFLLALSTVVVWAVLGPVFHFSDTWQLVINTGTTIITFLMVFLIQNTQNRDTKALHLKLDELLLGVAGARTSLVDLEDLSDEELDRLQCEFERIRGRGEGK